MKLKIDEFERLAARKGYSSGWELMVALGAGKRAYSCFKKGKAGIGYDLVKEIYNTFGEYETVQVIDFEEETVNGFKSKFIRIGTKLY